jgi:DNA-binding cell septation regulator SpoVG
MRNVDWNKVKAILTIKTSEGFEIKNCKLVEGQHGLFVASPSVKGKDDTYHDIVWFPQDKRDELNKMAEDTYDPDGVYEGMNQPKVAANIKVEDKIPF